MQMAKPRLQKGSGTKKMQILENRIFSPLFKASHTNNPEHAHPETLIVLISPYYNLEIGKMGPLMQSLSC